MEIDVVMPFHNEVDSVGPMIDEWLAVGSSSGVALRIVACEDGSTDGTRDRLFELARTRSMLVVAGEERKGYSQAMVDGVRSTTAPWVVTVDGDGQYFAEDLPLLIERCSPDAVVVGVRSPRHDSAVRKAMSRTMALACWMVHRVRLEDMSSPFNLIPGDIARQLTIDDPLLPQGYWWEFHIRRERLGVGVVEVPVRHRARSAGETRVYLPKRNLPIVATHARGLWELRSVRVVGERVPAP